MGKVQVSYIDDDGKETILRSVEESVSTNLILHQFFGLWSPKKAPVTFGEIALLFNTPRTASIKALDHCVAWTINRYEFSAIISSLNKVRVQLLANHFNYNSIVLTPIEHLCWAFGISSGRTFPIPPQRLRHCQNCQLGKRRQGQLAKVYSNSIKS